MVYYGILLFFVVEYVRPISFIPALIPLHLNSVVPVAVVIAVFFSRQQRPSSEHRLADLNTKAIGFLLILLAVSVVFANWRDVAYTMFSAVVGYALIAWAIVEGIRGLDQLKGVFKVLVAVHILVALLSPDMLLNPTSRTHVMASGSFLGDGNDFALSINIAIPFCLFLLFEAKSMGRRLFYIASLLFLVVCVIATQSRGGSLALAAVMFYYWTKSDKKLQLAILAGAVVAVMMVYAPPAYFDRMDTIASHEDGSAQGRIVSWTAALNFALGNPALGVGAGNFPYLHYQNAHSIYFMILGELGFPGLGVLLFLIIWNVIANTKLSRQLGEGHESERRLLAGLSASMIAFAIAGAFLSAVYYPHLYVLAGLMTAGRRIVNDRLHSGGVSAPVSTKKQITYHWALAPSLTTKRIS